MSRRGSPLKTILYTVTFSLLFVVALVMMVIGSLPKISPGCFTGGPGYGTDVPFFSIGDSSDAEDFFNQFSAADQVEMKKNAGIIIDVGRSRPAITERDLAIAIATAIQESNLQNLDHGDRNSHGLFQQQWDQGWGTIAQTMDPVHASTKFYEALEKVPNRAAPRPMIEVAMEVQRPDPSAYYARWAWDTIAPQIVASYQSEGGTIVLAAADTKCQNPTLIANAAAFRPGLITGSHVKGDDYPYASWPIDSVTPTGLARECVDFVQWRLNEQSGSHQPPYKFKNVGNAKDWKAVMTARGYEADHTPAIGAVAWFDAYGGNSTVALAGSYGHVAIVSGINAEKGTVILEHYNGMDPPNNHRYSVIEAPINMKGVMYLHIADIPVLTPAMAVSHG